MRFGHHETDKSSGGKGGYNDDFFDAENKCNDADGKDGEETLESVIGPILL